MFCFGKFTEDDCDIFHLYSSWKSSPFDAVANVFSDPASESEQEVIESTHPELTPEANVFETS